MCAVFIKPNALQQLHCALTSMVASWPMTSAIPQHDCAYSGNALSSNGFEATHVGRLRCGSLVLPSCNMLGLGNTAYQSGGSDGHVMTYVHDTLCMTHAERSKYTNIPEGQSRIQTYTRWYKRMKQSCYEIHHAVRLDFPLRSNVQAYPALLAAAVGIGVGRLTTIWPWQGVHVYNDGSWPFVRYLKACIQ